MSDLTEHTRDLLYLTDHNLRCTGLDPKHARPIDVELARRRVVEACRIAGITVSSFATAVRQSALDADQPQERKQ